MENSQKPTVKLASKTFKLDKDQKFWMVWDHNQLLRWNDVPPCDIVIARSAYGAIDIVARGDRKLRKPLDAKEIISISIAEDKGVIYDSGDFYPTDDTENSDEDT